jgi:PilZ domain
MSAATSPAFEENQQRVFPRHPVSVPLDVIALRSGVPDNLPGRCTDISEAGVGAVVAGELAAEQQVAIELRLPNVGVPVRARAVVRYQSRLHCGLEFVNLSVDQRELIRYWVYRATSEPGGRDVLKKPDNYEEQNVAGSIVAKTVAKKKRKVRLGRRGFYLLLACVLVLAAVGWWEWQRSWNELEKRVPVSESGVRVSPETSREMMARQIEVEAHHCG